MINYRTRGFAWHRARPYTERRQTVCSSSVGPLFVFSRDRRQTTVVSRSTAAGELPESPESCRRARRAAGEPGEPAGEPESPESCRRARRASRRAGELRYCSSSVGPLLVFSRDRRQTTVVSRGRLQDTRFHLPSSKAVHGETSGSLFVFSQSSVRHQSRQTSDNRKATRSRSRSHSEPESPERLFRSATSFIFWTRSNHLGSAHGETAEGQQRQSTVAGRTLH